MTTSFIIRCCIWQLLPAWRRAPRKLGVRSVPAVAIDGKLSSCCAGRGPNEATLRATRLSQPVKAAGLNHGI
jgi:hypothetical protein